MRYPKSRISSDPIRFYSKLMSLESYEKDLKTSNQAVAILSGIIVYRQLHKHNQMQVVKMILNLPDGRLKAKLYGLVSEVVANPYWFNWSLSDNELRHFFETNKEASSVFKTLGIDVNTTFTVAGIAGLIFGASKKTIPDHVKTEIKNSIKNSPITQVGQKAGLSNSMASYSALILIAMVTVLLAQTEVNSMSAKKELLRRGLLLEGDL